MNLPGQSPEPGVPDLVFLDLSGGITVLINIRKDFLRTFATSAESGRQNPRVLHEEGAHGLLHREIMRSAGLPVGGRHRDLARSGARRYRRLHVTAAPVHERWGRSTIEADPGCTQ